MRTKLMTDKAPEEELFEQRTLMEKVIGTCIIALLGWTALTVQTTSTKVAVIEARLQLMPSDQYSSRDADRDNSMIEEKLKTLSARIDRLEGRTP
jgi:hypothetical protein